MSSTRMSALESAFLGLESRDVPFQHAAILLFDRPIQLEPFRAHVDAVLAKIPRYRQHIERSLLRGGRWIDDSEFRIERHVDSVSISAPGGMRELEELAARLIETELSDDHPPWRLWTVMGVEGGHGAIISVVHHSLVDGMAGFRLLEYLMGARPEQAPRTILMPQKPDRLAAVRRLVTWKNFRALGVLLREGLRPASQIGINPRRVGRSRVIASHGVELERVKAIEHAFEVTNNDVVLATVTGALRRMLIERGFDADTLHDVRAMVPVGRHATDARAAFGNRVVLQLAPLPIDEADPVETLLRVSNATRKLKRSHTASAGDLLVALSDATSPALLLGTLKLALRLRGFNTIVTNVPGPAMPLSLLGATLTRIVPVVNLWPHVALGFAVASYANVLTFGIQTDRAVIRDAGRLRDHLAAAFDALFDAATHRAHAA